MSRLGRIPRGIRVAGLVAMLASAAPAASQLVLRHESSPKQSRAIAGLSPATAVVSTIPTPSERSASTSPRALDQPTVNYRGPIRLIHEEGGDHPEPEVFPRSPLEIVTDDCTDMELFDVDNSSSDRENRTVTLRWWDPGVRENRFLTILMDSPSCSVHRGALTWA